MATSPSSGTSVVVLDASAVIRALVDQQPEANTWLNRVAEEQLIASWPAHLYVEIAHTLVRLVRAGSVEHRRAAAVFAGIQLIAANVRAADQLEEAMTLALERQLSVYDAAYVVLAEALGAPLVTADRRLAEATDRAVLLPG